jgi:hypothetical protein
MKQIASYLSCLFFFKIAVGAILLVTGWDSLAISGNGLVNITVIMALSFFPATFARPLFQRLGMISIPKLLSFSLCIAGALIITEHFLKEINLIGTFIVHFILWIFIFIIEVACEKWYVVLSQNHELTSIRKLSGISTSIGQLGIIFGPILIILSKEHSQALPYWIILVNFIIACAFSLSALFNPNTKAILSDKPLAITQIQTNNRRFWYVLGLALIWPTLTIFNLSIPVLAKTEYNSINVAGFLEILLAMATVIAGLIHPYITRAIVFHKRTLLIFVTLFIATSATYIYNSNFILVSLGIFLLGLTFGYLRVELRAYLSQHFEPKAAGEIVAAANSWGGLLVIIYAGLFYVCTQIQNKSGLTLTFPISFILCAALFIYILNYEANDEVVYAS